MKNAILNKLIIYFGLLSLTMSCASFPKKQKPSISLDLSTINLIQGSYALKHVNSAFTNDSISDFNYSELDYYPTLYHEIHNGLLVKRLKINPINTYTFSINILNTKRLEIDYCENGHIIRNRKIRYKIKDDGYLYIKHRNFKIVGIPYVIGGFKKKRSRLSLNSDDNLLFETSEFGTGGVFYLGFIFPVIDFGSKIKYEKIYQRID